LWLPRGGQWPARIALLGGLFTAFGCSYWAQQPELAPTRFAPATAVEAWREPADAALPAHLTLPPPPPPTLQGRPYDLLELIDLALRRNPQTRAAWQEAIATAAAYGRSRAAYYPYLTSVAQGGYSRLVFQAPNSPGAITQWQFAPQVELSYVLLDFGRRRAASQAARQQSIAANFSFNRKLQDLVFTVEKAFYELGAAQASVIAAQRNLALAQANRRAVTQRRDLGLATQPQALLAIQVEAQSVYDLETARVMVRDAQAHLAIALGIRADTALQVQSLQAQRVASNLPAQVDQLIDTALRQRPDLAAQMALVRASEARMHQARAAWMPTLSFSGAYGESDLAYQWNGPPTVDTNSPQYSALLTLQWDIFTGFDRLNADAQARADAARARAQLQAAAIDASAQVWQAYYNFRAALRKFTYARSLLAASQEAYQANLQTYAQGLSTIVELLTAARDLAGARYTLIQSKAELLTASAAVSYAVGASFGP